jgi:hypothetical protein
MPSKSRPGTPARARHGISATCSADAAATEGWIVDQGDAAETAINPSVTGVGVEKALGLLP